jgi:adenine-specific DNA methylase
VDAAYVRAEGKAGRIGQTPLAVITTAGYGEGKEYRTFTDQDLYRFEFAQDKLSKLESEHTGRWSLVPDEPLPLIVGRFNVHYYGINAWGKLFNPRQNLALATFAAKIEGAYHNILSETGNAGYARALLTYLGLVVDRIADYNSTLCTWHNTGEKINHTFTRQSLPMVWDYIELNPFSGSTGDWTGALDWVVRVVEHCVTADGQPADARQGTVTRLSYPADHFDAVVTDPPYYDAVPYADLSDFFYVWLKRTVGGFYPDLFRFPLTPKSAEIVQMSDLDPDRYGHKSAEFYERQMTRSFEQARRVLKRNGRCAVMFAHKSTAAWETLLSSLVAAGLVTTASWPLHTEMGARLIARGGGALASSFLLICRPRASDAGVGYYDQVRSDLETRIRERLDFFWAQGIRGSDFFISAIGPAMEVYGQYAEVRRLSGEPVTVGEFLLEVRSIVTDYALSQVLHNGHVGAVDPATRFYVLWRWAYANNDVPFDDGRVLAQALGAEIDDLMHRTDLLRGRKNLKLRGPRDRVKRKEDLGEPRGGVPAPLIDVVHRACVLWEQGERVALSEFLNRALHGREEIFWSVTQSLSDILPEKDKERQLLHGLLVSQDRLPEVAQQDRLL